HVVQQKQGRVQATRQMKGSVPLNDDAGLEHEADVMGARALQSNAISSPPKSTNTTSSIGKAVQRVQKTLPTAGKLNMIGETHTDYPHIGSRQLESKTLRQMLADGYQYYTEDKLKTSRYDSDYADPMDLRLKQIIGLVHGSATFQLGMLSEMDADQIERANEEANKASMALQSVDVNEVMKMFAPRIASTGFDKDALVEEMGINTQRYSLDELEKLSDWATWEEIQDGYKPDSDDEQDESSGEDFDSNFDEIQAAFADAFRVRSLEAMKSSSSQDMGASSSAMSDGGLGLARRWAMHQFENFINDYKGRFSPTLKQYYSLKKDGEYQWQPHFRFDLALIPPLLAIWERLEGIQEQIHKTQGSSLNEHLPSIIRESRACLADLCQILMQGAPSGFDPADGDSTVLQRSLAMNRAAQANQNVPIIWKVGNKHVEDIHRLEQAGRIPTTGYYYILEKDFRHRYNSGGELAGYSGSNDELGPGYQQAEATWQKEIERADRKLASRFPGEDQLASLEHLDLGNLVTNQTRLIVEAVEQGALPNLQRLTISEVSMTPQLRGRLLAQGIEVVLTQVAPQ
ncbi:MAG TPA: hypothetical protein DCR93_25890, partial [Cytophagales bacterium]|nr:hypothetical protein [Cytophagales bacterium]